jgi:plastocyanin
MPERPAADDPELGDSELIESLRNHRIDRRSVVAALGAGGLLSLGVGSAAASHDSPHPPRIDPYYGYSAPADERLPGPLQPDREVELHIDMDALTDGDTTTLPFHFEPMGLAVGEGDVVRFDCPTPEHTVSAYHPGQGRQRRVPSGTPPFSSPLISAGGFWLYEFDRPGTYDLFCAPHQFFGMVMRIVVGDPEDDDYDGTVGSEGRPPVSRGELAGLGVTAWPFPTSHEVFETAALDVDAVVSNGSVAVSDVEADL